MALIFCFFCTQYFFVLTYSKLFSGIKSSFVAEMKGGVVVKLDVDLTVG